MITLFLLWLIVLYDMCASVLCFMCKLVGVLLVVCVYGCLMLLLVVYLCVIVCSL